MDRSTWSLGLRCFMRRAVQFPWDRLTKWLTVLFVTLGLSALFSVDPIASFWNGSQIGQA